MPNTSNADLHIIASRPHPGGPGHWMAVVIPDQGPTRVIRGRQLNAGQERLELTALLEGLRALPKNPLPTDVRVHTDSEHIQHHLDRDHPHPQHSPPGRTGSRKEADNRDLWAEVLRHTGSTQVTARAPTQGHQTPAQQRSGPQEQHHPLRETPPDHSGPPSQHPVNPATPLDLPESQGTPAILGEHPPDHPQGQQSSLQGALEAQLPTLFIVRPTPEGINVTTPLRHNNGEPVVVHLIPRQDSCVITDAGAAARCLRAAWSVPPPQHLLQARAQGIRHSLQVELVGGYLTTTARVAPGPQDQPHLATGLLNVAQATIQLCCPADTGEISSHLGE